jgi:hypothetical protein
MSIIIEDFKKPATAILRDRFPQALAESPLNGENPYHRKLQELCSIPNPYRKDRACHEGPRPKDEYIPSNPYRSDERKTASRPRHKRLQVFDTPNPYR